MHYKAGWHGLSSSYTRRVQPSSCLVPRRPDDCLLLKPQRYSKNIRDGFSWGDSSSGIINTWKIGRLGQNASVIVDIRESKQSKLKLQSVRILPTLVLAVFLALTWGCAQKIVKPTAIHPALKPPVAMIPGRPITEQVLQTVQAELKVVYFEYDQYTLDSKALTALQYNADILRRTPNIRVVAEGHCDERGTAEYNLALGERRAQSVVEYLASLGVLPARMSTVSYGSELPIDPGHNETAWAKNRRVYLRAAR